MQKPESSLQEVRKECINYEAVNELGSQSMKISNTLLGQCDVLHFKGRSSSR